MIFMQARRRRGNFVSRHCESDPPRTHLSGVREPRSRATTANQALLRQRWMNRDARSRSGAPALIAQNALG